jgi:hypothetical protein
MKLAQPCGSSIALGLLASVVLVALSGCGDDFVAFSDVPPLSAGSAGSSSTNASGSENGGSASQAAGGAATVAVTAGSGAGGSSVSVEANAAGTEPGSGGASAAGAGGEPSTLPTDSFELIDDVEGPFPSLPQRDGRSGGWFTVHDDSNGKVTPASAVPLQPVRGTSHFAASMSGAGFTDWGAQLGVSLKSPADGYDASKYCGLRFLAKGTGAGWTLFVSDRASVPEGGVCVEGSFDAEQGCYHYVGKRLSVSSEWQEVKLRFDELRFLDDPDSARRLDPSALYDIVFNFNSAEGSAFQLLVDDLSFIDKNSASCQ